MFATRLISGIILVALALLIVGSGSGMSLFPLGIAKKAHTIGARIVPGNEDGR